MMKHDDLLTIAQLAEITGLSRHTLRFYERIGLIDGVDRADNGRRLYSTHHIAWLEFVIRLRSTGMPIPEIQRYAELLAEGDSTVKARLQLLENHRHAILQQVDDLHRNLVGIEEKILIYKSSNGLLPQSTELPNRWSIELDPDSPTESLDKLPPHVAKFLKVRDFQRGLRYFGEAERNLYWARKYRFWQIFCQWYAAFPDFEWHPTAIVCQGDLLAFEVRPTGTHITTLDIQNAAGEWQSIPPTDIKLDGLVGRWLVRSVDGAIVAMNVTFHPSLEELMQTLLVVALEQN